VHARIAATPVWSVVVADGDEFGGRYLQDCRVAPIEDTSGFGDGVRSCALDPKRAEQLWAKSEALVREKF
jgi:hypothetical protein